MSSRLRERSAELASEIKDLAARIGRPVRIMEVCGTHTVSLRRTGIHSLLPESVRLISGPGCPVCVTPTSYIDNAIGLLEDPRCVVVTFGDMIKVPGSDRRTLSELPFRNRLHIVYSPMQLADLVIDRSVEHVVFLAIGFETTIPTILSAAAGIDDQRFVFYTAFKLVPPALEALLSDPQHGIDGFLLPGHVSMIIGSDAYQFLERHRVPGAIAGFDPVGMLRGIRSVLKAIEAKRSEVVNEYPSVVKPEGNTRARELMDRMLEPVDAVWRGLGAMPESALAFRPEYASLDAARALSLTEHDVSDPAGCLCGSVIRGRKIPTECAHFGGRCTPSSLWALAWFLLKGHVLHTYGTRRRGCERISFVDFG